VDSCIEKTTRELMKQLNVLNAARSHKPFNPSSSQHRQFLQSHLEKARALQQQCPWLNLEEDIRYFEKEE